MARNHFLLVLHVHLFIDVVRLQERRTQSGGGGIDSVLGQEVGFGEQKEVLVQPLPFEGCICINVERKQLLLVQFA